MISPVNDEGPNSITEWFHRKMKLNGTAFYYQSLELGLRVPLFDEGPVFALTRNTAAAT